MTVLLTVVPFSAGFALRETPMPTPAVRFPHRLLRACFGPPRFHHEYVERLLTL